MLMSRKAYPSDVSDDEWALVAPYFDAFAGRERAARPCLARGFQRPALYCEDGRAMAVDAQRSAALGDCLPAGAAMAARGLLRGVGRGCRVILRLAAGRAEQPTAAVIDSRTLRSTPESGARAAYDGAKRKKGSKLHLAVNTLGHLLALHVTPANADDRARSAGSPRPFRPRRAKASRSPSSTRIHGQGAGGGDRGAGIALEVVKLPEAKREFVLLPRRWVVERSFAWATRFRRLVKDYERCAQTSQTSTSSPSSASCSKTPLNLPPVPNSLSESARLGRLHANLAALQPLYRIIAPYVTDRVETV